MADTDATPAVSSGSSSPREDAATKSAREELKHTVISEKQQDQASDNDADDKRREATPSAISIPAPGDPDALKEHVSSPKKKRAHAEVDAGDDGAATTQKADQSKDDSDAASAPAAEDAPNGSGARAEPEKKRLRDESGDGVLNNNKVPKTTAENPSDNDAAAAATTDAADAKADKPTGTAPSAFAASGFAKHTSAASPFGTLGGAGSAATPSLFGSSSSSVSPFGALGGSSSTPAAAVSKPATTASSVPAPALAAAPTLSFGGGSTASPFASLQGRAGSSNKVFGSAFGSGAAGPSGFGSIGGGFGGVAGGNKSGFGSALSGTGLSSFAKPGASFKSDKPSKPFGAPESDPEDDGDEDSAADENENGDDEQDNENGAEAEDKANKAVADDKKKQQRLQRVTVDDGEAGEATLLQVRARMYYLDKALGGWKERGAGMLKVNVPERCVEFDQDGNVIPASFDASTIGGDDDDEADEAASDDAAEKSENGVSRPTVPKRSVVRLIMRQDSTLRVILNTVVLASTEFKENQTLKATTVLFTAFEGSNAQPVNVQAKMNIPNAKTFLSVMEGIQRELRGD